MVDVEYGKLNSPAKDEGLVVVARSEPTVSCVPVAMSVVPRESETTMEFAAKEAELVPPLPTGRVPVTPVVRETWPPRVFRAKQLPAMEKQPDFTLTPPIDEKLVVAGSKLTTLLMEKREPGVDVAMPM